MKITTEITIYEVDGESESGGIGGPKIIVSSHWNHNGVLGLVVLQTPDGKKYTVRRRDMDKALSACTGLS